MMTSSLSQPGLTTVGSGINVNLSDGRKGNDFPGVNNPFPSESTNAKIMYSPGLMKSILYLLLFDISSFVT
jgi:hypothetical protein